MSRNTSGARAVGGYGCGVSAAEACAHPFIEGSTIHRVFIALLLGYLALVAPAADAGEFCADDCIMSEDFNSGFSSGGGNSTGSGFGSGTGNWVNIQGENGEDTCSFSQGGCHDWYVLSGETSTSANVDTDVGPTSDHTDGLGNYLYVEASGNGNDEVHLLTPAFSIDASASPYATFFVYSNSVSVENRLHVDVMNENGDTVESGGGSIVEIGDTGIAHWRPAFVDLSDFSGTVRLRFRWARHASNDGGHDIAIDDFAVVADRAAGPGTGGGLEQTYIVPATEDDILDFLQEADGVQPSQIAADPVETYTAIAIARDNVILYVDEWEDGYENDVSNPAQTIGAGPAPVTSSTQIWGDGYPENGYPPGYPHDVLTTGDVVIVREPEIESSRLDTIVDHDARDIIASTDELAITRAFWAAGSETLNAGALELFPTSRWGGSFEIPIGEDINPGDLDGSASCGDDNPFQEVALFIMADTDGTQVSVDFRNGGGANDFQQTVDRGESVFVGFNPGSNNQFNVGATVTATGGNVQVHAFTVDEGSNYGSRFYTLLPTDQFTDNYIAPFDSSSGGSGELIIYNPNASDVDVDIFTGDDPVNPDVNDLTIPAGDFETYVLPTGSANGGSVASRVQSTGGEEIYVLAVMDSCDDAHDWGGALLPDDNLTSAILIPLGFGTDPTLQLSGDENHSPVWVTPIADTFVYVDFDGDFVPDRVDLNGDGDTDDVVGGISEAVSDQGMEVDELQLLRLHDPTDQDQSGTLVFSMTTGGFTGGDPAGLIPGATLAGGWGQDMDTSGSSGTPTGAPSIDVGTAFAPISFPDDLPVTLDRFRSRQMGSRIRFAWGTASETFTVGFNLWGKIDGEWRQLNRRLMTNRVSDSTSPQRYRRSARIPRGNLEFVGISSVDTDGTEHFFGPFEVNESYGSQATPEPIPWNDIRAELDNRMRDRGYVKFGKRFRKHRRYGWRVRDFRNRYPALHLYTEGEGMHRVTYEQLRQAGVDLKGVPAAEIAVTHKGQPIPRYVREGGKRRRFGWARGFGSGGYIDFHAEPVSEEDERYTTTNVYQLHVNRRLARTSASVNRDPDPDAAPRYYIESTERDANKFYALGMPTANPWYEQRLLGVPGGRNGRAEVQLDLDRPATSVSDERTRLRLGLAGETAFRGTDPDHMASIALNGDIVEEITRDGRGYWEIEVPLPAASVKDGANTVEVEVPGVEGFIFDILYADTYAIDYPREFVADGNTLVFTEDARSFEVRGFNRRDLVAYAVSGRNLARVRVDTRRRQGEIVAQLPGVAMGEATYWVSSEKSLLSPEVVPAGRGDDLVNPSADYIIVAHPAFIEGLENAQGFLAAKQAQGYAPHIVDVNEIIDRYGYGIPNPAGIRRYLQAQDSVTEIKHVLLVGGATSDPLDYTGSGSIDFVPTTFTRTGKHIYHTPADGLLVDLYGKDGDTENLDGVPDRSIGRWPVRTASDLETIIDKTLQYQQTMESRRSALLVAGATDPQYPSFSSQVEDVAESLRTPGAGPWDDLTRVYVDDFSSVGEAQSALKQGFAGGNALTLFSGHGSTSSWTFQGLMDWQVARSLANAGLPTLVGTMSCYTSYFVSPSTNTIGHQLLLSGDRGAALIQGAATLTGFSQNQALLGRATDAMIAGQSAGEAVLTARRTLGGSYRDVITNWSLLGDPSLSIDP